ncbi:MAG: hypothetical protein JO263_02040, partial [Candidatus Eremiobacteraeota bacterium]|nr:hypothetical protein [Candidatus Eremiobacteraeota bacterium]
MRIATRFAIALLVAACGSPSLQERTADAEIHDMGALKRQYPDVVSGFDLRPHDTLVVSLDLQHYIEMDDDAVVALKRDALERWRAVWLRHHPHEHGILYLRFIDFIGRKVA